MKTYSFSAPLLLAALLLTVYFSGAAPVKLPTLTVAGRTYTDATLSKADALTATVIHSGGVARVPLEALPAATRIALGYDPAAAKAKLEDTEKKRSAAADLAKFPPRRFIVISNMDEGLLTEEMEVSEDTYSGGGGGLGRLGGGGGSDANRPKRYSWGSTGKQAFFGHTEATRTLAKDSEFTARVTPDGTMRINNQDVVPRLSIQRIEPNQPAKKPG